MHYGEENPEHRHRVTHKRGVTVPDGPLAFSCQLIATSSIHEVPKSETRLASRRLRERSQILLSNFSLTDRISPAVEADLQHRAAKKSLQESPCQTATQAGLATATNRLSLEMATWHTRFSGALSEKSLLPVAGS